MIKKWETVNLMKMILAWYQKMEEMEKEKRSLSHISTTSLTNKYTT